MKNETLKKYVVIMLAGIILNIGLYWIAHVLHLPAWLDTAGTAFAAVALEPAAGLVIGYLTNLFESNAVYMSDSIIYYAITALCALVFGSVLRKNGKISWKRLPAAALIYLIGSSVLSAAIAMWRTGPPNSGWERYFFDAAQGAGLPEFPALMFAAGVLKTADTAAMCALVPLLCAITPDKYKNEFHRENLTWKSPFN